MFVAKELSGLIPSQICTFLPNIWGLLVKRSFTMSEVVINEIPKDALVFWNRQWLEYCQWIEFKQELEQEAHWYFHDAHHHRPGKPR
tara:strand:- start:18 stop:278 length:261 start_codon:yes stop_codon:yes gene_type:complete